MVAYGTKCQIQAAAIVEEPGKEWWLVLGLASPQSAHNFKSYLRARVQSLDLERMTTLTPWLRPAPLSDCRCWRWYEGFAGSDWSGRRIRHP